MMVCGKIAILLGGAAVKSLINQAIATPPGTHEQLIGGLHRRS